MYRWYTCLTVPCTWPCSLSSPPVILHFWHLSWARDSYSVCVEWVSQSIQANGGGLQPLALMSKCRRLGSGDNYSAEPRVWAQLLCVCICMTSILPSQRGEQDEAMGSTRVCVSGFVCLCCWTVTPSNVPAQVVSRKDKYTHTGI